MFKFHTVQRRDAVIAFSFVSRVTQKQIPANIPYPISPFLISASSIPSFSFPCHFAYYCGVQQSSVPEVQTYRVDKTNLML
jgi:hypothetical protein